MRAGLDIPGFLAREPAPVAPVPAVSKSEPEIILPGLTKKLTKLAERDELDKLSKEIKSNLEACEHSIRTTARMAWTLGQKLIRAKKLAGTGNFSRWLAIQGVSDRNAQRYMQIGRLPEPNTTSMSYSDLLRIAPARRKAEPSPEAKAKHEAEIKAHAEKIESAVERKIDERVEQRLIDAKAPPSVAVRVLLSNSEPPKPSVGSQAANPKPRIDTRKPTAAERARDLVAKEKFGIRADAALKIAKLGLPHASTVNRDAALAVVAAWQKIADEIGKALAP